jgi:hypothetical protein
MTYVFVVVVVVVVTVGGNFSEKHCRKILNVITMWMHILDIFYLSLSF